MSSDVATKTSDHTPSVTEILEAEARIVSDSGNLRARDMAQAIGVTEGALVQAHTAKDEVVALRRPEGSSGFGKVLEALAGVGPVMALTRNQACVSEKHGIYGTPTFHGAMGQFVGEIDLRLFLGQWAHGYAVKEETRSGLRQSLQFFDAYGNAVHKVYRTSATDSEAFDALVAQHRDPTLAAAEFADPEPPIAELSDDSVDIEAFLEGWRCLEHSHDYHGLLRKHGVTRSQAMRLGSREFTSQVPIDVIDRLFHAVEEADVPLMIFVGNSGCIQIFSGRIHRVVRIDDWLNVLDPGFNLHLRTGLIDSAWVVRKPSMRGDVHALELFDAEGTCIAQVFGERKPGTSERQDWRTLIQGMAN